MKLTDFLKDLEKIEKIFGTLNISIKDINKMLKEGGVKHA
ncbi:hypothetical protein SAMN02745174_02620 [Cetobacterium ceti]|uniref:Uncharacterized protein n=1 Tax=Cetobacterium ceti TaxID=180163 RepID=A0A1T4R925_9FUSO|nr:hypothetical protein SAMN02745174_02620 [Cetobacterium ceti]